MRRKSASLGLPCPTHMVIHCCRVSLRYSWLMGCARVRRAGWNSTTDSGRYLNQLLSFKSSSSTPPLPGITVRDQPSTGHPPACTRGQLQGSPAGFWPVVLSRVEKSNPQGRAGSGAIPSGTV